MKKFQLLSFLLVLLFLQSSVFAKGHLVIIGGGDRTEEMDAKIIEFAGGVDAKLLIVPNASGDKLEAALYQKERFEKLGSLHVDYVMCDSSNADSDSILRKLDGVTGVFFTGGDQSRLTGTFIGTEFLRRLHEIYEKGGVMSGTSAGAAVMSEIMLTGNELLHTGDDANFAYIQKGNIETVKGFGFVTLAIIDQHFLFRKRHNRLISVILENKILGVGIDEPSAILVYPDDTFEVMGETQVVVYDPSDAKNIRVNSQGLFSAQNIKMTILLDDEKFDLKKKKVVQ